MRIAIAHSPGSSVLYLAQELGMFEKYGVDVELAELNTCCESWECFDEGNCDAAVVSFAEFMSRHSPTDGSGVLMLLAVPDTSNSAARDSCPKAANCSGEEILIGNRSKLMLRRDEWQRVLLAYEHARLLAVSDMSSCVEIVAEREHSAPQDVINNIAAWSLFSIMAQDSLLSRDGPYSHMNAHWQGRLFLTSAVSTRLAADLMPNAGSPGDHAR
ncbi:MAG: hypothetical protein IPK53_15275 [bacterium]|nr:hypothetical protein [bacterium]